MTSHFGEVMFSRTTEGSATTSQLHREIVKCEIVAFTKKIAINLLHFLNYITSCIET